jgi:hypothetical protein
MKDFAPLGVTLQPKPANAASQKIVSKPSETRSGGGTNVSMKAFVRRMFCIGRPFREGIAVNWATKKSSS